MVILRIGPDGGALGWDFVVWAYTVLYLHSAIPTQCYTYTVLYLHSAIPTQCYTYTVLYLHSANTDTVLIPTRC
jgi:hypothetical protein